MMTEQEIYSAEIEKIRSIPKKFVIFGTKAVAQMAYMALTNGLKKEVLAFCIAEKSSKDIVYGIPVIEVSELMALQEDVGIVVASFKEDTYIKFKKYFIEKGYNEIYKKDALLWYYQTFVVRRPVNKGNFAKTIANINSSNESLELENISVILTNLCSLRCRDCGRLTPYYQNPKHINVNIIKESMTKLAQTVDYIKTFVMFGGEPFLYPDLHEVCYSASGNENVLAVSIITNGTIVPDPEELKEIRDTGAYIIISDYGKYSTKKRELITLLESLNVIYEVAEDNNLWHMVQRPQLMSYDEEKLKKLYDRCVHRQYECNELQNGHLYMCGYAAFGAVNGEIPESKQDSVNLLDGTENKEELRRQIKDLLFERDYIEACKYCRTEFEQFVVRGEQL